MGLIEKFLSFQPWVWDEQKLTGAGPVGMDVRFEKRTRGATAGRWSIIFLIFATVQAVLGDIANSVFSIFMFLVMAAVGVHDRREYETNIRMVRWHTTCPDCAAESHVPCEPTCPNPRERFCPHE